MTTILHDDRAFDHLAEATDLAVHAAPDDGTAQCHRDGRGDRPDAAGRRA